MNFGAQCRQIARNSEQNNAKNAERNYLRPIVEPLNNGPANFGVILLLYGGCPLLEVKLHCHMHDPVGTTKSVLYREVKCIVSFKRFHCI